MHESSLFFSVSGDSQRLAYGSRLSCVSFFKLLTKGKRHKVVRFLISPKKKKVKIEVNKIMNPAFLLGTAFNIAYWHRKYHSGTICKGVSNPQTSKALSGCEKEEIPK